LISNARLLYTEHHPFLFHKFAKSKNPSQNCFGIDSKENKPLRFTRMKWPNPTLLVLACLLLSACGPAPAITPDSSALLSPTHTFQAALTQAAATLLPTAAPTLTPSPEPSPTPTRLPSLTPTPALELCSPLQGYALADLTAMISNPYHPPKPGSDDPHHGVDLAVRSPNTQVALAGNPVLAALPGRVAAVMHDRFPYGSAVLVETPLEAASPEWWAQAGVPAPAPTLPPHPALTCPAFTQPPTWDESRRSLYVLYAHMQSGLAVEAGQQVTCGQALGSVGDSGNALNPHLHFEVRTGPAAASLGSMAHYDASASPDEMATYCLWRVSGLFQLVDPMQLLSPKK
jgi:murein DD-endopeptidase MepM/ murein hydrolase activator NlpD